MRFKFQIPALLRGISAKGSALVSKIENSRLLAKVPKKVVRAALAILVLLIIGSAVYFPITTLTTQAAATETATLQTTTVRTGSLVIYASGSGTLIAADEVDLAFKTSGQVEAIYFEVGDQVKAGDLLAEVNDTETQIKYTQAKRNLLELTSVAAIASAEEAAAAAQSDLDSANNHLAYLISPDVFLWELEVKEAQQAVADAKAALEASPNDKDLQAALEKAEAYLDFAEDKLEGNWYYYDHEYLPDNFTTWDKETGTKYIAGPTDTEIMEARAAVTGAEATLQEAKYLYAALTGGEVSEDATGSGLSELESAQLDLESAQVSLDGTKIYAPISGTIMSIDTSVGDAAGTGTVITVADLSQYYLETFFDETDWGNVTVGCEAEIVFDALPEKNFTGEVIQVDPGLYTSGNTSVVRAIVKLDTSSEEINLPIGTAAAVDVIGGKAENAMLVPIEALHQAGDQYTVFVMENGEPRLHVVEVGIQDLLYAEIKSGLNPGDVVTTGISETQ
ncbi:MAG: efflux RND transporter periplasmic adaptor subunit [Chloroflexi bacterium]|nr:efflux RND transporter periplasmic adaptor subunit [Chloroflexota bacterium]